MTDQPPVATQVEAPAGSQEQIHWPSLIAAIAAISAVGIAIGLGLPLLTVLLEKRGIPASLTGLNTAMAGIAAMIAAPITTKVAHSIGVANTMLWAVVIAAISALGFYYIENFWAWFPLRLVFHGAITALFILSEFWINVAAPPRKRGLVLGIYATVLSIGFALGNVIFSLVGSTGLLPFGVGASIIFLAAVPIFWARRESPDLDEKPMGHFLRYLLLVPTASFAVFVFGAVEAGGMALFPIFANYEGFSESQAGFLLSAMAVGNVIFQIPVGMISDRIRDRRKLLTSIGTIGLIGSLLLPFVTQDWRVFSVLLLVFGGAIAGLYTVGLSHLGSRFRGAELAAANAAFIFSYAVGTVVGPQAIGIGMDVVGGNGYAWTITCFFAAFVLFGLSRLFFHPLKA
ncbi:MAG: MFS transporter [Rhizobiaceae bacterium]|nr:MFS transporter [Rhizobiaceae bacterium]